MCVWQTGKSPDDGTQSTFVPLYKKRDPSVGANYRTISLIFHASKSKVILGRITPKTEFEVAEEQAGFGPQRGTHNHLCSLRILTEKARSRRQPLYMCFVDFEKAFDKVNRKKLWKVMVDMGFVKHLVALIRWKASVAKCKTCPSADAHYCHICKKRKILPEPSGPLSGADLRLLRPQPDTSFYTARPRIQGQCIVRCVCLRNSFHWYSLSTWQLWITFI